MTDDPLLAALIGWLMTPDWRQSEDFLIGHPELVTDAGELALLRQILAETDPRSRLLMEDHAALLSRCRDEGVEAAFAPWRRLLIDAGAAMADRDAALARVEAGHTADLTELIDLGDQLLAVLAPLPVRHRTALVDQARALLRRHRTSPQPDDLDVAVAHLRSALRPPLTFVAGWSETVADAIGALLARGRPERRAADLEMAVTLGSMALESADPDSGSIAVVAASLGHALKLRHDEIGATGDLTSAIRCLRLAAGNAAHQSKHLVAALERLGGALAESYLRSGDPDDLVGSIAAFDDTLALLSADSSARPGVVANLVNVLLMRHDIGIGRPAEDLDRATALANTVSAPSGSPWWPTLQGARANVWRRRYEAGGDPADLERAIGAAEEAVAGTASGAADHASQLVGLARLLTDRADRLRSAEAAPDLNRAVELCRSALRLTPELSFRVRDRANVLATTLLSRYLKLGAEPDLAEALDLYPPSSSEEKRRATPNDTGLVFNTGNALWIHYRRTGDLSGLDTAIRAFEQAARDTPETSVDYPACMNSLAVALAERHQLRRDPADLRRAVSTLRDVVARTTASDAARVTYVTNLAVALRNSARVGGHTSELDEAAELLESALGWASAGERSGLLYNLGAAMVARYRRDGDEADLRRAVDLFKAAVADSAEATGFALYLSGLGRALLEVEIRNEDRTAGQNAASALRRAIDLSLTTGPEIALRTAVVWGRWAERRRSAEEAATAFGLGVQAAHRLFAAQPLQSYRREWLREAGDVHVRAAWTSTRAPSDPGAATVFLERGRALLLSETLAARRIAVARLENEHSDLAARFVTAVGRLADAARALPADEVLPFRSRHT